MIVLDARVLIAHLNRNDALHARAEGLLLAAVEQPFAASSITLAEVLVGPARAGQRGLAVAALRNLEVREVPVPAGSAERLATLRAETGLKLPDCCVLLAAQDVAATAVLTLDDRLGRRAVQFGYGWTDPPPSAGHVHPG